MRYGSTTGKSEITSRETGSEPHIITDGILRDSSRQRSQASDSSENRKQSGNGLSYRSSRPASYQKVPDGQKEKKSKQSEEKNRKKPGGRPPKKKRGCLSFLIVLIILLAAAALILRFALKSMFAKVENYALDTSAVTINESVSEQDANIENYQNIALFGVDDQDNEIKDTGSRTDCIIIASINKSTKKVKLMSIYRDTYVSINGQYDKINAAYSYGGPELALSTINRNLDLNITDFATVNFKALADAVDILGGISLTISSEKELENLNDYIGNMNKINGGDSPKFESTGTYTFDGNQAVAYSRIRYMEGGDHARASHQRLVLEGIIAGAKKQPWKLPTLISTVLPQCKTSLSADDMTSLAMSMFRAEITDSQAYPFDSQDERYGGIYYGFPLTAVSNVKQAHEYLFGTKDYEPTEELTKISAKIQVVTDELGLSSD